MDELIKFLEEMIEASREATIPLDMGYWHCGTSCCLMGDLTVYRDPSNASSNTACIAVANELENLFEEVLEESGLGVAESIYLATGSARHTAARLSGVFTNEELRHQHLHSNHSDRAIAIDFIKLVINKIACKST